MALFSKSAPEEPVLLERETRTISQLTSTAYEWLGARYAWYNKIRTAKQGGLAQLFAGQNLEEQMEATRSALTLVTKTLNAGLVTAFNATVETVQKETEVPEGWPAKIDMPDRSNPPSTSNAEDTLIITHLPLKFINLSKMVRDKGQGIDMYAEGLVKKLYFKVIGFYADPANWDRERMTFFLSQLAADAEPTDISSKLGAIKQDLELVVGNLQMFRFGAAPRNRGQSGIANTLEETFEISDQELLQDLYFQSLLVNGIQSFLLRYCVMLMSAAPSQRVAHSIAQMFTPGLAKAVELRVMFQGSFSMEREKVRLRKAYQDYYKQKETLPTVETQTVKGRPARKINYSHRLIEHAGLPVAPELNARQAKPWLALYQELLALHREQPRVANGIMLEVLQLILRITGFTAEGKQKLSAALRTQADEEEKLGRRQMALKKKAIDEAKRKKMKASRKFKVLEQDEMARTVAAEAEQLEADGLAELERFEQAITKRRDAKIEIAKNMDATAQEDKKRNAGRNAGGVFSAIAAADAQGEFQAAMLSQVLLQIQESPDEGYFDFYRSLFNVMPALGPLERMMLRKAVESRMTLQEGEMPLNDEDRQVYEVEVKGIQSRLEEQMPQIMNAQLTVGQVRAPLSKLLELGMTGESMRLILQLPFSLPNKPAAKLPPAVAKEIFLLNRITHPFAQEDLILPNVEPDAPPAKRLNVTRLAKTV